MGQSKVRALVCDDEPLVALAVVQELAELGIEAVGRASDGFEVVELAIALRPDVIIMDIAMPDRDGIEATRLIMERCPTPVVVLSGYSSSELAERAAAAGAGAYLVKPTRPQELERAIAIARARLADLVELRRVNEDLKQALATVKTLSGILPICSSCKKIRDEQGCWHRIEVYIRDRSQAEFTHGLCPECAAEYFADDET